MKRSVVIGFIATLVAVATVAFTDNPAEAYINPNINILNDIVGIAVSPVQSDRFEMVPGGQYEGRFRVRQTGTQTSEIVIEVAPLTALRDYETETDRTRIKNWTTFTIEGCDIDRIEDRNAYVMMRSQEECYVNYNISVPFDAVGGSQNASILVRSTARDDIGQESASSSLRYQYQFAYALWSDVDAEGAYYEGKILENNIPWLLFSPPLGVSSLIKNTGTLDITAKYNVTMKNYFGGDEVFNESWDAVVFADSELTQSKEWEGAPELGLFQVTQEIAGVDETSSKTQLVLMFPLWLLLILVGVIILLIWALVLKIKQRKNKK